MIVSSGVHWGVVLSVATFATALLSLIWQLVDVATKANPYQLDRNARIVMSIGFLLIGYGGAQGDSPVRTLPGALGTALLVVSSFWITLQMRKRAGEDTGGVP